MPFTVTITYANGNEITLDGITVVQHNNHKSNRQSGTAIDITSTIAVDENGKTTNTKIEELVIPERRGENQLVGGFDRVLYYPNGALNSVHGRVMITH